MTPLEDKANMVSTMTSELCQHVRERQRAIDATGAVPCCGYEVEKSSGVGKTQLLGDIRRLRRELLDLYRRIERGERDDNRK